jgi:hypothetical protein
MHPMSRLECAAHTILAMIDVLSTVFRTREHAAHVRVQENWYCRAWLPAVIHIPSEIEYSGGNTADYGAEVSSIPRYMQHILVTAKTTIARVHLSQHR